MKLDTSEWQARLETIKLKHLYYLCELFKLPQSIGRDEVITDPDPARPILRTRSQKRNSLGERIWQHIERTYQDVHGKGSEYPWLYAKHEGALSFIIVMGLLAGMLEGSCVWRFEAVFGKACSLGQ